MGKNTPAKPPSTATRSEISMSYQGPLPPSLELQKYNELVPGAAEAIINNFIEESKHRRAMEQRDQNLEGHFIDRITKTHNKGLWLAFFAVLFVLGAGTLFMFQGYPVEGAGIIGTVVVGIAGCFIYGSRGVRKKLPPTTPQHK